MYNTLDDNLITVTHPDATCSHRSIPGVLADCMTGTAASFPSVREHQAHSWHAFLVQLAAIAMERNNITSPPTEEQQWRQLLNSLTDDIPNQNAWNLIVNDPTQPAFMQPPTYHQDQFVKYNQSIRTPDKLDITVTSANHDIKDSVLTDARQEDWLMALITVQTAHGFSGNSLYGVSRMNKGYGNRPGISLAPMAANPGLHIRRDLTAILEFLPELRAQHPEYPTNPSAPALMWTSPWDGSAEDQLDISHFHPLYIEICRRIRFVHGTNGGILAVRATSRQMRTTAKELLGYTGDPWTPIEFTEENQRKAITINEEGFTTYKTSRILLSPDWRPPLLAKPTQAEAESQEPMVLISRTLVRGQGTTSGFHHARTIIRPKLQQALRHPEDALQTYDTVQDMESQYNKIRGFIRDALKVFGAHGESPIKAKEGKRPQPHPAADSILTTFQEFKDLTFWECLQNELEAEPGQELEARKEWLLNGHDGLVDSARFLLTTAVDTLPSRVVQRRKAKNDALSHFERRLRAKSGLPWLFENDTPKENHRRNDPAPLVDTPPESQERDARLEDLAANIAGYISQLAAHRRGDLATIKHLDPNNPNSPSFHNILARYDLDTLTPGREKAWAWLAKNMALNTPNPGRKSSQNTVHNPFMPLGKALFTGGQPARSSALYSETRFNALLNAKGESLLYQMALALTILGQNLVATDWRQVARIVLYHDTDPQRAEAELDRVASDYNRAARTSTPKGR